MNIEEHPFARLGVKPDLIAQIPPRNLESFVQKVSRAILAAVHPDWGGKDADFKQIGKAAEELSVADPKRLRRLAKEYADEAGGGAVTRLVAADMQVQLNRSKEQIQKLRNDTLSLLLSSGELLTKTITPCRLRVTDLVTQAGVKNKEGFYHAKHTYYLGLSKSGEFSVRRSTDAEAVTLHDHRVVILGSLSAEAHALKEIIDVTPRSAGASSMQLQSSSPAQKLPTLFHPLPTGKFISRYLKNFGCELTEGSFLVVALIDKASTQAQPSLFVLGDLSRAQTELEPKRNEFFTNL